MDNIDSRVITIDNNVTPNEIHPAGSVDQFRPLPRIVFVELTNKARSSCGGADPINICTCLRITSLVVVATTIEGDRHSSDALVGNSGLLQPNLAPTCVHSQSECIVISGAGCTTAVPVSIGLSSDVDHITRRDRCSSCCVISRTTQLF